MSTEKVPPTETNLRPNDPGLRTAPRVIALLTAALGVAVVVATIAGAAVPAVAAAVSHSEQRVLDIEGVSALDVDVDGTELTLVFGDVDEATLDVRDSGGREWKFERDNYVLRVATPRAPLTSWLGRGSGEVTLTLPNELAGVDVNVEMAGGSFEANGTFGEVGLDLAAGRLSMTGTADALVAGVGAGRAEIELSDVGSADLSLGAGELVAKLRGRAPDAVTASVTAGSLELALPDAEYDVTSDSSAGEVDNRLRTDPSAARSVFVEVSAGSALLTSAR